MELLEGKSGFELQGNCDCSARATLGSCPRKLKLPLPTPLSRMRRTRLGGTGAQGWGRCSWSFIGHVPALGSWGPLRIHPGTHRKRNLGKEIILGFAEAPEDEVFYFLWPG